MPSSNHGITLARLWELLRNHLPSRLPGRTSRELCYRLAAAGYKVEKRTVEHYMTEFSHIFPIIRNKKSIL